MVYAGTSTAEIQNQILKDGVTSKWLLPDGKQYFPQ
jgi:hypothetical protein